MYTHNDYLATIRKRLENSFELTEQTKLGNIEINLLAVYEEISGRTFVSQSDIIDRLEKYERFYFTYIPTIDIAALEVVANEMVEWANQYEPNTIDHMSTTLTAIAYGDTVEESVLEWLQKFKYTKFYSFAMKGWCDIRFVVVNLNTEKVSSCKLAKRVRPVFDVNVKSLRRKNFRLKSKKLGIG